MLKIIGTTADAQASLELDPHVPFTLRLGIPPAQASFIWDCSEKQSSQGSTIVEIWVHPKTAAIHKVTLVSIDPARVKQLSEPDSGPTIPTPGRIPVCDTIPWTRMKAWNNPEQPAKMNVSETSQVDFVLGSDFASLRLSPGEPASWIVNQRARFGVNAENVLCRIDLINLRPEDIADLREAVAPYEPKQD